MTAMGGAFMKRSFAAMPAGAVDPARLVHVMSMSRER
jgi:hypothetical protein